MATTHHNLSGILTKELLAVGDDVSVSRVSLVNTHASNACTLDLYIEKTKSGAVNEGIFYILKNMTLPVGATLILEKGDLTFSNKANEFGLYVKLTQASTTADVIIS